LCTDQAGLREIARHVKPAVPLALRGHRKGERKAGTATVKPGSGLAIPAKTHANQDENYCFTLSVNLVMFPTQRAGA
jgi:hypothetical protein